MGRIFLGSQKDVSHHIALWNRLMPFDEVCSVDEQRVTVNAYMERS